MIDEFQAATVLSFSSDPIMIADFQASTGDRFLIDPIMTSELQELKEVVKTMQEMINNQSMVIAEQTSMINTIHAKLCNKSKREDIFDFPMNSIEDLKQLDVKLRTEPEFETDLKIFLSTKIKGKVGKNFNFLISDELLKEINWNGRRKMKAINTHKLFESTLYAAVHDAYKSYEEYERDIRDAIQRGKNKLDQRRHQGKLKTVNYQ